MVQIQLEPELEEMFRRYQTKVSHSLDRDVSMATTILDDPMYVRRTRMPKWNVPVSMLQEPKVAIRHTSWGISTSKSANAQRAEYFSSLAQRLQREWDAVVELAIQTYGNQGSLVSGVYRDHFPNNVKDRLRFLAHGSTMARDAARLHEYLSKTRSPLFR